MILEGLVTTIDVTREGPPGPGRPPVNVAPMGPQVDERVTSLILRPYRTSRTYRNLKALGEGVFHVTDDVLLLARAAVGEVEPPVARARSVRGYYLPGACRFYEFRVTEVDERGERAALHAQVVHQERLRDFLGFNRARHAVVEAAILATRLDLLPREEVLRRLGDLEILVEKTGGRAEREAFDFLRNHVREYESKGCRA